jgi:AAA domain-containing protein
MSLQTLMFLVPLRCYLSMTSIPHRRSKGEEYNMMANTDRDGMLPPKQPCIQTSTLKSFVGMAKFLAEIRHTSAMIGIAVGAPGIGKSEGIRSYQEELMQEDVSSTSISVKVHPRPTPHSLITWLMVALEGTTNARRRSSTLDDLAEAIDRQNRQLVILDGADRLYGGCFDVLCTFFDRIQRPLLLVGLPQLLLRSLNHSQLFDRIGLTLKLVPLSYEEVLQVVLPALVFPGWVFDPDQEADRLLGERLWEYNSPSFRRLRNVMQAASTIAHIEHEPKVTDACIRHAMQLQAPPRDRQTTIQARLKERKQQIAKEQWHECSNGLG